MEVKLRKRLRENSLSGIVPDVEVFFQRITRFLAKASEGAVVSTPYEISEGYASHLVEVEFQTSSGIRRGPAHAFARAVINSLENRFAGTMHTPFFKNFPNSLKRR